MTKKTTENQHEPASVSELDPAVEKLKLLCRFAPFAMILSGVPILLGVNSQAAQGTMMATIDALGVFAGIACLCGSVFMYVAALLRLKSITKNK
jgi:hypothetical protein